MRTEPVQLHLAKNTRYASDEKKLRLSSGTRAPSFQALDEAFAAFSDQESQAGQAFAEQANAIPSQPAIKSSERARQNQALVANVVSQLEALDRQRQRLAQLLEDVNHADVDAGPSRLSSARG